MFTVRVPRFTLPEISMREGKLSLGLPVHKFILLIVGLLLVFNYGFMQLRIAGIPIGEITLLIGLISINHRAVLPVFLNNKISIPLVLWWVSGILSILWCFPQYGLLAIRDGSHVIESLYLYLGFCFAGNQRALGIFKKALPTLLVIIIASSLLYPSREMLSNFSPTLLGNQEQPVALLFNFVNTAMILLASAAFYNQRFALNNQKKDLLLVTVCLTLVILLFPSRTLILEFFVFFLFLATKGNRAKSSIWLLLGPAIVLLVFSAMGLSVNGRLGEDFQVKDYLQIFLEIFSTSSDGITSGNELRYQWWQEIIEQWSSSWGTIFLGLGYGMPLTDFVNNLGSTVREPHNDIVSILGRGGLISLTAFLGFQSIIVMQIIKIKKNIQPYGSSGPSLIFLISMIALTWMNALGESPFIMSFYAIPYYFSAGILLRANRLLAFPANQTSAVSPERSIHDQFAQLPEATIETSLEAETLSRR